MSVILKMADATRTATTPLETTAAAVSLVTDLLTLPLVLTLTSAQTLRSRITAQTWQRASTHPEAITALAMTDTKGTASPVKVRRIHYCI